MAFKPYLLPVVGLPDTFTIETYKPATDLSKKRERSAKYAFKGRKYRDLFNAIPFNAPKDAIEEALRKEGKTSKILPYKKNPIEHVTEKRMPMIYIPWFPKSASIAEKIAERAVWNAVAKALPITCFAENCGFLAPKLDQLKWHLNVKHDIQYLGYPKDRFGTTLRVNQNGKSFRKPTTALQLLRTVNLIGVFLQAIVKNKQT